jgi:hypothetical protein
MSEYSPPNWTEPLSIYNPINFQQTSQSTNGGGGGGSGFLKYPVAQGSQTMKNTLISGSFSVQAGQAVSMGGNIVQSGGTPVNPTDLATKAYVDLNAGTQNLSSVLTAGNTTGNFNIEFADTYASVYNGSGGTEKWVVGVDPNSFISVASNDLYVAGNTLDNYMRIGNATGGTFSEVMKVGIDGASAKSVAITGTLSATSITDSASSVGTSGQVLTCGGGGTLTWGAGGGGGAGTLDQTLALGNTATGTYANITLTDTSVGGSANPIMTLVNTEATNASVALEVYKNKGTAGTAADVLFNQSVYGKDSGNAKQEYTRITHTIRDATASSEDGSIELGVFTAGSYATYLQLNGVDGEINCSKNIDMVGNNIRTSTGNMLIESSTSTGSGTITITAKSQAAITSTTSNIVLTSTAGSINSTALSAVNIVATNGIASLTSTNSSVNINAYNGGINLYAGATNGILTNQLTGVRSILRTGYTNAYSQNLDYYPTEVVENTGTNTLISLPYMPFQNLIIVNSGVSPTYNWADVGSSLVNNPTAIFRASSGMYWVGVEDFIYIYPDANFIYPPSYILDIQAGSSVNVFYEKDGFMYVGGQFAGVVGQPIAQFSLMRFAGSGTLTPSYDPMFSSTGQNGFNGPVNAITSDGTNLYVGGSFTSTFITPMSLENLCIVGNPFAAGGTQTYTNDIQLGVANFAANGEIYAMCYSTGNVYYTGNFTQVASGFQLINYAAFYTPNWTTSSNGTMGLGNFDAPPYSLAMAVSPSTTKLIFTGNFNFTENSIQIKYCGYLDVNTPFNAVLPLGITGLTSGSTRRNTLNVNGGLNMMIMDDLQVWYGDDINLWEDGGVAYTTLPVGVPSGILSNGTTPYAIIDGHTFVRIGTATTGSSTFTLPSEAFKTPNGSFAIATLPQYTSQQFIADVGGAYYHAVGTPICSFSN